MKYPLFQLLAICAQFCAAEKQVPQATASEIIPKDNQAPACADPAGKPYFPKDRESYYAEYYRAANLPSLQDLHLDKGEVRFRVAFLPSFSKPLFLTYARDKDSGLISIARLSGRLVEGEQPGKVELQGAVRMKPKVAEAFEKLAAWPEVREPLKALDERLLPL